MASLSADLFDPDEEMPTEDDSLHELETKSSWVNYTLMQQRLPTLNEEQCDSILGTVHPLLKRLVALEQKLQDQERIQRHARREQDDAEQKRALESRREVKSQSQRADRLQAELTGALKELSKAKKAGVDLLEVQRQLKKAQSDGPSNKSVEKQLQNRIKKLEVQIKRLPDINLTLPTPKMEVTDLPRLKSAHAAVLVESSNTATNARQPEVMNPAHCEGVLSAIPKMVDSNETDAMLNSLREELQREQEMRVALESDWYARESEQADQLASQHQAQMAELLQRHSETEHELRMQLQQERERFADQLKAQVHVEHRKLDLTTAIGPNLSSTMGAPAGSKEQSVDAATAARLEMHMQTECEPPAQDIANVEGLTHSSLKGEYVPASMFKDPVSHRSTDTSCRPPLTATSSEVFSKPVSTDVQESTSCKACVLM